MKINDIVIRTKDAFLGMQTGDLATLKHIYCNRNTPKDVTLQEFGGRHLATSLRLATKEEIEASGFIFKKSTAKISEPLIFN